jgi:hypothetical protein
MRTSRTSLVIAILTGGLLTGSAVGVAAQDEADALRLVTEEVEPGVERIISDGAGHDLDETHPTNRYDTDGIAIAADGTVWLTTTYHGSDNTDHDGSFVWALGQPDTYTRDGLDGLVPLADGTLLVVKGYGDEVVRFDGDASVPDDGPMLRQMADGGLLLRIDGADLAGQLPEGEVASIGDLYAVWDPEWDGWSMPLERLDRNVWTGDYSCWPGSEDTDWGLDGDGVSCARGRRWAAGEPTTYLAGTSIRQLAAAPDGSVWAVGEYDGGPGGLYRITLPPAE